MMVAMMQDGERHPLASSEPRRRLIGGVGRRQGRVRVCRRTGDARQVGGGALVRAHAARRVGSGLPAAGSPSPSGRGRGRRSWRVAVPAASGSVVGVGWLARSGGLGGGVRVACTPALPPRSRPRRPYLVVLARCRGRRPRTACSGRPAARRRRRPGRGPRRLPSVSYVPFRTTAPLSPGDHSWISQVPACRGSAKKKWRWKVQTCGSFRTSDARLAGALVDLYRAVVAGPRQRAAHGLAGPSATEGQRSAASQEGCRAGRLWTRHCGCSSMTMSPHPRDWSRRVTGTRHPPLCRCVDAVTLSDRDGAVGRIATVERAYQRP